MFQDMLAMSSGGGGSAEWIEATYTNGNTYVDFVWNYDADSIVVVSKWAANSPIAPNVITLLYIDVSTSAVYYADSSSYKLTYFASISDVGFANAVVQKQHLHLHHASNLPFAWSYIIPLANTTPLI